MKIDQQIQRMEEDFKKLTKNPFKMLGSYSGLGAFVLLLISNIQLKPIMWIFDFCYYLFSKFGWCADWQSKICLNFVGPVVILLVGLIFFAVGWKLQMIIRKIRYNRKIKKIKNSKIK
jgi:hypothetical protein